MDAIWAEETLRDEWSNLTHESVHKLTLLATGDENAASDAATKKAEEEVRASSYATAQTQ